MINPTPIYNKLKYVSAECGSGKTTSICNIINDSTERYILVQNTQELIKKTQSNLITVSILLRIQYQKMKVLLVQLLNFFHLEAIKHYLSQTKPFLKFLLNYCPAGMFILMM